MSNNIYPGPKLKRLSGNRASPQQTEDTLKTVTKLLNFKDKNKNFNSIFPRIELHNNIYSHCYLNRNNENTHENNKPIISIGNKNFECVKININSAEFDIYKFKKNNKHYVYRLQKYQTPKTKKEFIQEYLSPDDGWISLENLKSNDFDIHVKHIAKGILKVYKFFYKHGIRHNDFHLGNIMYNTKTMTLKVIDYDKMTFSSGNQNNVRNNKSFIEKYKSWYVQENGDRAKFPDTIFLSEYEPRNFNVKRAGNKTYQNSMKFRKKKYDTIKKFLESPP